MQITLSVLANAAANLTAAGNGVAAAPKAVAAAPDPFLLPTWLIAGGVIALVLAVVALASIAAQLIKPGSNKRGFAEMLCRQVWASTDTMTREFAELLRQPPGDIVALRVTVRTLREHLSGPLHLVDQMHCHPPSAWPDYALFAAFSSWGSQLKSMGSQLADLQHAMTYPVVKEPVDKHRDAMLVHHYLTEQAVLLRAVEQVRGHASAICIAAKPHLSGHGDHGGGACPCCDRAEHDAPTITTSIQIVIPPAPEKPPAPPPPPAAVCCCAAPRPCQCARGCGCACLCTVQAPAPAKAPA